MTVENYSTLLAYYMDKHILFKANDFAYIEIYEKEQLQLLQLIEYYNHFLKENNKGSDNEKFSN